MAWFYLIAADFLEIFRAARLFFAALLLTGIAGLKLTSGHEAGSPAGI